MTKNRKIYLSYSAIAAFKACPMRFMAKYIAGLRPVEQSDILRRGSNWASLLEICETNIGNPCPRCRPGGLADMDCPCCEGTYTCQVDATDSINEILCRKYDNTPQGMTTEQAQTAKAKLLYSIYAYMWYWDTTSGQDYQVLVSELPFEMPVVNPGTGYPARDAILRGKIDKVVRLANGRVAIIENKSTSQPIESTSKYWDHLRLDTQTTLYPYAMLRMQKTGELEQYGIKVDEDIATTVLYDVWKVPAIKMKKLSQSDSIELATDGRYCGEDVETHGMCVETIPPTGRQKKARHELVLDHPTVDGQPVTVVQGKGGVLLMETEGMYGARVYNAATSDLDDTFARREISRSLDEMSRFEGQLYSIYQCILHMRKTGHWYTDERQCTATFTCPYIAYCWHGEEIKSDNVLEGFECMWEKDNEQG